jgi:4-amino-4-deoxy-L-arabinose transferase-like glycosyltransferase
MLKKLKKVFKREFFQLALILLLAFSLRLYRINNPVADWHAFRQADTASVTREYVKADKIDLLRPHYQDLSNIQSGFDNLEGYRMVEFPFVNAFLALILRTFKSLDLVLFSRLASVFISLLTILVIYKLVKEISGKKTALLSAFVYAVLPYSVFYSRAILPEPYFLFFSTLSIWQFYLFAKTKKFSSYFLALLGLILAALLKPFVVFLAPVYLMILWQFRHNKILLDPRVYLLPILAFAPLLLWREWIKDFPTGVPVSDWLFNGNGIRLRPAWFRWLFYERLTKLFLGYFGLAFLAGNLFKKDKGFYLYGAWWLSVLLYFVVIASGNVQHDYYQNFILPIVTISVARGMMIIYEKLNKKIALTLLSSLFALTWIFAAKQISGYFNVNHWEYVEAGKAVDQLVDPQALVIAPAMGDTQFLFQTNRRGWPIGFEIQNQQRSLYLCFN